MVSVHERCEMVAFVGVVNCINITKWPMTIYSSMSKELDMYSKDICMAAWAGVDDILYKIVLGTWAQ